MPARSTAEMWTKASGWPSSRVMKPKPLVALKNLTVPLAFSPVSSRCGRRRRRTGAVARRPAILDRERIALDLEVGRRHPAAAIDQGEFERLAFGEAGQPGLLDRADMDEHVLAAIVADDEAEALLAVEEFDDALGLADDLGRHAAAAAGAAAAEPAAAAATAAAAIAAAAAAAAEPVAAAAIAAATAAEAVAAAPFSESAAAEVAVFTETVALVSAAPAALSAAPSVETHPFYILSCARSPVKTTAPGKARNGLWRRKGRTGDSHRRK